MSMLAEPNTESPANVDAAKMWREDRFKQSISVARVFPVLSAIFQDHPFCRAQFKKRACASVRKSLDMA